MMVIDAAALIAVLGVATWAGMPHQSDGFGSLIGDGSDDADGATEGGMASYWGPRADARPADADSSQVN